MIAGAVVLKNGRIIDSNTIIELHTEQVTVCYSTFCEPTAPRDCIEVFDLDEVKFIRPFGFGDPDIHSSFDRICEIALDDLKRTIRPRWRCKDLS